MYKFACVICILLMQSLIFSSLFAQEKPIFAKLLAQEELNLSQGSPNDFIFLYRNAVNRNLKGNPYLSNEWQKGILIDKLDRVFEVEARYEVLHDEIQLLVDSEVKIVNAQSIQGCKIGDKVFLASEFMVEGQEQFGYLELLSEGDICLLKRYDATSKMKGDDKWVIPEDSKFFYEKSGDLTRELDLKRRTLLGIFAEKEESIKSYIKDNDLDYGKEPDLIQLFNYYNSISKS